MCAIGRSLSNASLIPRAISSSGYFFGRAIAAERPLSRGQNPRIEASVKPSLAHTNGKAERFIRTLLAGWAYGAIYATSAERTAALDGWLWTYDHRRPHGALSHKPPIARLTELNNLAGSYR
jgi:hypothetical protein